MKCSVNKTVINYKMKLNKYFEALNQFREKL